MRRKHNKIPKLHVKKGDTVIVLSGKDKGKTGKILKVFPKKRKVIVEGVNLVVKRIKPNSPQEQGRIETLEAPIYACKVQLIHPKTGVPTRIGRKLVDGKWVRYTKKEPEVILD